MSESSDEKGLRRRQAAKTGALSRVLQEVKHHGLEPSRTEEGGAMEVSQARARTVFFPTKGAARVPAHVCRPWRYADRPDGEFEHLDGMVASFKSLGQIEPIVVRPLSDSTAPEIRYEVIVGRVRWQAAVQAGTEIDVVVRDLDDRKAFDVMNAENRERRNLSDYAYAKSYARALKEGLFQSAVELADSVKITKSVMSYYLGFAELDAEIVQRLSNPKQVSVRLGYALAAAVKAGHRAKVLRDLAKIESGEIARDDIPAIWEKEGSATRSDGRTGAAKAGSPLAHTFKMGGQTIFSAKISAAGSAVIRFPKNANMQFSDALWQELEGLIQRHRGEGK